MTCEPFYFFALPGNYALMTSMKFTKGGADNPSVAASRATY